MTEYTVTLTQKIKVPEDAEKILDATGSVCGFKKDGKTIRFWFAYETETESKTYHQIDDITFQDMLDLGFELGDEERLIEAQ
jgi:hypothetical protein